MTKSLLSLLLLVPSLTALALEAPLLLSWQLDPHQQATDNIICAVERVTPAADGGLIVDISFSSEPGEAPSIQCVYSSSGGRTLTQFADGESCTFPEQSMTIEGRYVYAYTLPKVADSEGKAIPANRMTFLRRARFGGLAGRRLEAGGYAVIDGSNLYLGRSGTFTIGGQELTFSGGVCLEPHAPLETAATYSRLLRSVVPENTERLIRGKRLSFPVKLKEATE